MNSFQTKTILILSSLISPLGHAVVNGDFVDPSDYRDFTVRVISSDQNYCGGTMLTPNTLLTAKHCIDSDKVNDTITLIQGHDLNAPINRYDNVSVESYNVVDSMAHACDAQYYAHDIHSNRLVGTNLEDVSYYSFDWGRFPTKSDFIADCEANFDETQWKIRNMPDLVVVKLGSSLVLESSPLLRTTGDAVESYVMSGDEVTARGWGQTESGPQSTLLKQAMLVLAAGHSEPYLRSDNDSLPSRAVCPFGTDPLECAFDPLFTDQYGFKVTGSHVAPGDSGTPLFTSSNEVIGLLSTVRFIDRDPSKNAISADYVQYSAYNKFMLETVNDLVMPSHVIADMASGANYTFTLQNLSPANTNIVLVDGEIEPGLTAATTCPATLAPNADCLVTLIVDGNQLGLAQGYEIEVKVSDSRSITLTTNSDSDEDKEEDDKDYDNGNEVTPTPGNGGSSGGSVGIFVLAMLGFIGLRRQF